MKSILITDSLFVRPQHEQRLRDAGYAIVRLDKPQATEAELCEAIKGMSGYIIGGLEKVTANVIDAADALEAIVVPAIGYKTFLPGWKRAAERGIAVANTPDAPTHEASEWVIAAALMMNRHLLELGRAGDEQFMLTKGLEDQNIGIIGMGRIGSHLATMLPVFRPASLNYYSRHRKPQAEHDLGVNYQELSELLQANDVIIACITSDDSSRGLMGAAQFEAIKQDALFVSILHPGVIDEAALLAGLQRQQFRAISDWPMQNPAFKDLPMSHWYCLNSTNTLTQSGIQLFSDMAVTSMLNLLKDGKDPNRVN